MTTYTAKAFREFISFENHFEYVFEGRGWSTGDSYWQPGDQEMEFDSCTKYTYPSDGPQTAERGYDIDKALGEIAAVEKKPVDTIIDEIVQELWDNADAEEPPEREVWD